VSASLIRWIANGRRARATHRVLGCSEPGHPGSHLQHLVEGAAAARGARYQNFPRPTQQKTTESAQDRRLSRMARPLMALPDADLPTMASFSGSSAKPIPRTASTRPCRVGDQTHRSSISSKGAGC
jgi:hypothetical protein